MKQIGLFALSSLVLTIPLGAQGTIGLFEGHTDVGTVLHPGSSEYDAVKKTYTLTGSGENMWAAEDEFQFVWKKMSGDVSLTADINIVTATGDPHRKAALMIRRTLEKDSEYVDAVLHGSGLTALQSRDQKGSVTREVVAITQGATRLGIVRRGNYVYMMEAGPGEQLHMAGGSLKLALDEPFYIGLAACAHNKDATVQVTFSNVELTTGVTGKPQLYSTLETVPVSSTDRQAVFVSVGRLDSPMWSRDGKSLMLTDNGKISMIPLTGAPDIQMTTLNTGSLSRIGHHTAISPDGTLFGFTDETGGKTAIYAVPITGGTPKLITDLASSYFQGWSPDGKTILYCGTRNGKTQTMTMPAEGGAETLLGNPATNNDSPEYSPDGKYLYFNSDRTGLMQIWRMTSDGKNEEQLTNDEFSNWFPHVSPNGQQVAFMSYEKGVTGHPNDVDLHVRSMTPATKAVRVIANLTGGPASFHSAAWSPDSLKLALVSFQSVQ